MKVNFSFFLIACFLGLISCSDHALLDRNKAIENNLWLNKNVPEFSVNVEDANKPYNLYLNLRNTMEYPFSSIYVLVHQKNPDASKKTYRVKVELSNREGLWLGKSAGAIFNHQARFLRGYFFPDSGTYTFQLEQNMRLDPIPGINDVGLRIEPDIRETSK